jgi:probable rRNA maturation factor
MTASQKPKITVYWEVDVPTETMDGIDIEQIEEAVQRALFPEVSRPSDLAIVLTGDSEIQELNARYRSLDEVTDVLSFPQQEGEQPFVPAPDGVAHLGDVVISVPQARRQAPDFGRTASQETALLAVHGALHLAGYDHAEPEQEAIMRERERAALEAAG